MSSPFILFQAELCLKIMFPVLAECTLLCGDGPWTAFLHQQLRWGNFLTLLQLVIPGPSLPLCTRFADHEHACGCLWLPCFDPIHMCKEGSFLLLLTAHGMVLPCSFFFQLSYLAKNATGIIDCNPTTAHSRKRLWSPKKCNPKGLHKAGRGIRVGLFGGLQTTVDIP